MKAASKLPKNFSPQEEEESIYAWWLTSDFFKPNDRDGAPSYTIVIPPPNVTGVLHMGHALDHTLQDILIRYKRMDGFAALWLPGTDHAGIATQNVVEKNLAKENVTRETIGRKAFVERVWTWKEKFGSSITDQIKRIGASCDWSRERFTFDQGLSTSVRHAFVKLYKEGLIYRSTYLVNWDPKNQTAISDLEVEHIEVEGSLTYFNYQLSNGEVIPVATTRPETILGDTALAVAPDDKRYAHLIGLKAKHPFLDRDIPIIADAYVKKSFGTGVIKITPAHDPNDYEMGLRHQLPIINILHPDGTLNDEAGPFTGLDRTQARGKVLKALKDQGLWLKDEKHTHQVGHSQRSGAVVEPLLSKQWFVKTKSMAQEALKAAAEQKVSFVPSMWTKTYNTWLEDIRDWCISRQLWWGHQIPVWYCQDCEKETVTLADPDTCEHCDSSQIEQDPDVLDTWFSSSLWPFSTMGWPDKTQDFERFFPTNVLVTGFDIIFFWVARMMMMSLKFTGKVPFSKVHIHALVRDEHGKKMSKSKGNVVNPLELIDQYGADALRFTLSSLSVQGRDILFSEKKVQSNRNFINKLWNAARFIEHIDPGYEHYQADALINPTLVINQWMVSRLNQVIASTRDSLESMKFNEVSNTLYHFVWHEFCDWYLELSKVHVYGQQADLKNETLGTLYHCYKTILKLLHPMMPFVTENLWQNLPFHQDESALICASFPKAQDCPAFDNKPMEHLMDCITSIRTLRTAHKVKPSAKVKAYLWHRQTSPSFVFLKDQLPYLQELANIDGVYFEAPSSMDDMGYQTVSGTEIAISLEGLIDHAGERERLENEHQKLLDDIAFLSQKLSNPQFISKAPKKVIDKVQAKLDQAQMSSSKILEQLRQATS